MKVVKNVKQIGDELRVLEVGQTIIMPATIRSYVKVERLGVRTFLISETAWQYWMYFSKRIRLSALLQLQQIWDVTSVVVIEQGSWSGPKWLVVVK